MRKRTLPPTSMANAAEAPYQRDQVVALAFKLRRLRERKHIRYRDLIVRAGLAPRTKNDEVRTLQQRLSRWMHYAETGDRWTMLREDEYRKIIRYLYTDHNIASAQMEPSLLDAIFPDATYHSLSSWFNMSSSAQAELQSDFCGEYTIYRNSLVNIGYVLVGRLRVYQDSVTKAIKTLEEYRTDNNGEIQANDSDNEGYMFRRNGKYRILSKDKNTDELQYIYINETHRGGSRLYGRTINRMIGVVQDIQGNTPYASRILLERRRNDTPPLGSVLSSRAPRFVKQIIGRKPRQVARGLLVVFD